MNVRNQKKGKRNASQKPISGQKIHDKNTNCIKTRMQGKNILGNNFKNIKNTTKLAVYKDFLPSYDSKFATSHSQDDTKVTDLDQSEGSPFRTAPFALTKTGSELEDYIQSINEYIQSREQKYMIDNSYMRNHNLLNARMRMYLVRHIFKVCEKFGLQHNTLHLAVFYMDYYFSRNFIFKDQFQIIGIAQASLLIAMKYQEIYPPQLSQWVDIRYKSQIIRLEADMLKTLDYQLAHYTIQQYMEFFNWLKDSEKCLKFCPSQRALILMDLCLFDLTMKQFKPSQLARYFLLSGEISKGEFASKSERLIAQSIAWMIERNQDSITWLYGNKYRNISSNLLK